MRLLEPVASFAYHRRHALLIVFLAMFGAAVFYGKGAADTLVGGGFDDPGSESARANARLKERFGLGVPDVVVAYTHRTLLIDDLDAVRVLGPALEEIRKIPGVKRVANPYDERPETLTSTDGHTVIVPIRFSGTQHDVEHTYRLVLPKLRVPGFETMLGGAVPAARQAQAAARDDLVRAEIVTLPLLAVLLVVFFRGLVVASLPLLVGGFAVASALACIRLLTHFTDVSIFAMNIVTFVGLGVAIDYSLFMASRFRDELSAGVPVDKAVQHTIRTAGRTIAYSGGAVAVSLLALTVFPLMLLQSVALAGSLVVLMSLLGSLLFLPALLAWLGHRIEWLSVWPRRHDAPPSWFWRGVAGPTMKRPILVTLLVTGLLLALGEPFLHINAAVSGAAVLPETAEARKVADLLESSAFPKNVASPIEVAVRTSAPVLSKSGLTTLETYVKKLEALPHVERVGAVVGSTSGYGAEEFMDLLTGPYAETTRLRVAEYAKDHDTAVRVILNVKPTSPEANEVVHAIRALRVDGVEALVTSPAARLLDLRAVLAARIPAALAVVCLATFVVLFLAFGSVVMPLKAIIMNVLSLTASFGALVWIFQDGRLEELLDFRSPGNIELTIPVVMFAVVFGLAMDYELFLLSRIREAYDRTGDNAQSVTIGLERTGQLITRAALLLVAVMIGFMTADMLLIKELGVGMAVAVIVDATIVRALLVPATMQLLGHYNWWAPEPLVRLWNRLNLGVDERSPEELDTGEPLHRSIPPSAPDIDARP